MGVMSLSPTAAQRLAQFRRRTWLTIGLCLGWQALAAALDVPAAIGAPSTTNHEAPTHLQQEHLP